MKKSNFLRACFVTACAFSFVTGTNQVIALDIGQRDQRMPDCGWAGTPTNDGCIKDAIKADRADARELAGQKARWDAEAKRLLQYHKGYKYFINDGTKRRKIIDRMYGPGGMRVHLEVYVYDLAPDRPGVATVDIWKTVFGRNIDIAKDITHWSGVYTQDLYMELKIGDVKKPMVVFYKLS